MTSAEPPADEDRFAFGENWASFLNQIDQHRFDQAVASLRSLLKTDSLAGQRFLDIGSGSGLFSLAAYSMGADVVSMDFDPDSVGCTLRLKDAAGQWTPPGGTARGSWEVQQGSVLDEAFMQSLGAFDVVYSWGVLHHTGDMERAIDVASKGVTPNGLFAIAIYNDQGGGSRRWLAIKRGYHRLPEWLRPVYVIGIAGFYELKFAAARLASCRNPLPFADWAAKAEDRGMNAWHDWVDWIGGLPFEVATPEAIILPIQAKGFQLENLTTVLGGWGCNQFVFRRTNES